jgi:hypothetical protein
MFKSNKNGRERLKTALLNSLKVGFITLILVVPLVVQHQGTVKGAPSSTLNFQARLLGSSGAIVADGFYNVEFKLYNASSGGSALWTDTRYDTNGVTAGNDFRLRVKNGYLSVYLADTSAGGTAFPSNINWNEELWLTMNVGGATQTASPVWDGEMNPRIKLTALPYAFQASELAQTSGGNRGTLKFSTLANTPDILLPDADGTVCLQGASACGFAAGSGDADYIQNTTTQQTNANFNIFASGGVAATIQGASGQSIFVLNQNGGTNALTVQSDGDVAFNTNTLFVDAVNSRVGIGTTTPGYKLTVDGDTDLSGHVAIGDFAAPSTLGGLVVGETFVTGDDCTPTVTDFDCAGVRSVAISVDAGGTNESLAGVVGTVATSSGAFTLDRGAGFAATNAVVGSGTAITNQYGLYVENLTSGTNNYGIYVEGASTYALFVDAGATRLDGTVTAGATTITGATTGDALTVNNSTSTGNILVLQDNGAPVFTVADGGRVTSAGTFTGTADARLLDMTVTNQTTTGTQFGLVVTNANHAANAVTESLALLHNAETNADTVTDYLRITSDSPDTTNSDAIDVSDADLFNAINVGENFITGTNGIRQFSSGSSPLDTWTFEDSLGNDLLLIGDLGTSGFIDVGSVGTPEIVSDESLRLVLDDDDDGSNAFEIYHDGTTFSASDLLFSLDESATLTLGNNTQQGSLVIHNGAGQTANITAGTGGAIELQDTTNVTGNFTVSSNSTFTGNVGIGAAPSGYKLDIRTGSAATQVHLTSGSGDAGAYLTTLADTALITSTGAAHNGTNWIAKSTFANLWGTDGFGTFRFYSNSSLTVGNSFTPTSILGIDPTGNVTAAGQLLGPNGSNTAPSHSFSGDPNTGMYNVGAEQLGFATNGTLRLTVNNATSITSTLPYYAPNGSNTAPVFTFTSDPNTGMYNVGAEQLGFATNGTLRLTVNNATSITSTLPYYGPNGSNTAPTFTFTSDPNTGMYNVGAEQLGFSTNGTLRLTVDGSTSVTSTLPYYAPNGSNTAPSHTFTNDTNTGIYSVGADQLGISTGGTLRATFDSSTNLYMGNGVTNATPDAFAIRGTGSSASGVAGGALTLQGGNATVGNANGGNLVLNGGTGFGTGVKGLVVIDTPTIGTASAQNCSSNCAITQANVDGSGAVLINATNPALTATLGDPTITTAGRIMYVTNVGSNDFTLSVNGGGTGNTIAMKPNTTATMIWNGSDWTAAGASSSTDLQSAYNNTLTSAGGAELVLNAPGGSADGLTIRNNATTPISGGILEVQSSIGTNLFSVNNLGTELASNGGAETAGGTSTTFPASTWEAAPAGGTVSRTVTSGQFVTGLAGVQAVTTTTNHGVRNNLTANPVVSTTYQVSFTAKLSSGTFTTLDVQYSRDGGTDLEPCTSYSTQTLSTSVWTKITCTITTDSTTATNPDLIIRQTDGTGRTFWIDNLSFMRNDTTTSPSNVQIGGGINGGPITLFTLDRSTAPPVAAGNSTYLGSMYYDTTTGRIQCYESDGWGACGSAPDQIVTLTPEYTGAVLNGSGVGTMTADFCSNQTTVLEVNTSFCASGISRNYYRWTSPQPSQQTYSIYVSYKLPSTFKEFVSNDTIRLTALADSTTNGQVDYQVFRSTGSAVTSCGSQTTVTTSANTWQTVNFGGNENSCGFAAGNYIIFKVNVRAEDNANVYVENLDFTFLNV